MEANLCSKSQMTKIEQQKEGEKESQRGNDIKSGNEMTGRAGESFPSVDANTILCFTRLDRHTWDGPVKLIDVQQGY